MSRHTRFAGLAKRVARAIAKLERDQVCCGELTLQQFDTLRLLGSKRGATPSALAEEIGIDISTASRNLRLLQNAGYIQRERSATDGRTVTLRLSKRGEACLHTLSCDERMIFAGLLAKIPAAERALVVHALTVLDDALSSGARTSADCDSSTCESSDESRRRS